MCRRLHGEFSGGLLDAKTNAPIRRIAFTWTSIPVPCREWSETGYKVGDPQEQVVRIDRRRFESILFIEPPGRIILRVNDDSAQPRDASSLKRSKESVFE